MCICKEREFSKCVIGIFSSLHRCLDLILELLMEMLRFLSESLHLGDFPLN